MDIVIRGNDYEVSENLTEFIHKKISRLSRYLPNIASIGVEISQQRNSRRRDVLVAQITVTHTRGAILRAEERVDVEDHNSVKVVVNKATDKMYNRILRFKGRGKSRSKQRVPDRYFATVEELDIAEEIPAEEFTDHASYKEYEDFIPDAEDKAPQIIRRKIVAVRAMGEQEAAEQMELLGHDFFMFFNADTNQINVIYKRDSGGYGLLMPQVQ